MDERLPDLEFWFEFGSNYSYLSVMRIEAEAKRHGVKIVWKPFLLGPIFRALGMQNSPFVRQKEKGAYVWKDMARQCRKYGLQWLQPSTFPRLAVLPCRIALAGAAKPLDRGLLPPGDGVELRIGSGRQSAGQHDTDPPGARSSHH